MGAVRGGGRQGSYIVVEGGVGWVEEESEGAKRR
jgi:hypothetical protein